MKSSPPKRIETEPISFLRSPLHVFLVLSGLVLVSIAVNGYLAFRFDHLSQIPLIFIQGDPDLFPRDWFFQNFGHFKLRFLHLALIKSLAWGAGIPMALMIGYVLCIGSTLGAWLAIARYLFGSMLPGIVTCLMAIIFYGEIGANHLIERILIPRAEAYAVVYWGVYFLIIGRPALAGLLFGVASCFQPAVGIQFGLPLVAWIVLSREPGSLRRVLEFLGCYALVLLPWLLFLGDSFTGGSNLSDQEIIRIVAWIRHPSLMLPRFFGRGVWIVCFLFLFGSLLAWRAMARDNQRVRRVGWILPIMAGMLFLSTIFIEIVPVKAVIMFQPFRASLLFYLVAFLMLSPYLLDLIQSQDPFRRFRGVLLLISLFVIKLLAVLIVAECFLAWREKQGKGQPGLEAAGLAAMTLAGGFMIGEAAGGRGITWGLLALAMAVTATLHGFARFRFFERAGAMRVSLMAVTILGFGLIGSAFAAPWEQWLDSGDAGVRTRAATISWRYQIEPVPVMAIERLGVWAGENTPKSALFLMPPEKNAAGFRIWSRRSVVFGVKHFPVTQEAYEEWRNRYLAHCGILDPEDPAMADAVEDALTDYGTRRIGEKFANLSEEKILALAKKYEANYIVTPTRYESPELELLHSDFDRTAKEPEGHDLYLFAVVER